MKAEEARGAGDSTFQIELEVAQCGEVGEGKWNGDGVHDQEM